MITGPPGSGKTTTAIVLVLALLERRRPDGPVPVMVSMAAWDPARQPFEDWLAELIAEKYGLPSEVARDLVGRRRIIPILDGFDELPVEKAGWALRRINSAVRVDDPLVIVARDGSLGRAVGSRQGEPLRRALVLRLMPVPFPRVVHYLESLLPQVDYPGWNRWREELGRDGALAQALSLPANIKFVRSAYLDDRRPLPDFGSLNASGSPSGCSPTGSTGCIRGTDESGHGWVRSPGGRVTACPATSAGGSYVDGCPVGPWPCQSVYSIFLSEAFF